MSTPDRDDPASPSPLLPGEADAAAPAPSAVEEAWQIEMQLPRLRAEGHHELAAALGERLLEIKEAERGASHPENTALAADLAESYLQISRYERAEVLLLRVLREREAAASTDPAALGDALQQLAKLYRRTGALERVEPLLVRALEVHKSAPEPHFPAVASALHGLCLLSEERGDVAQAEAFCRSALEMREKILGKDALPVAESLNSLAVIMRHKGDLDEAERLYLRALAVREAQQGAEHPDLAITLVNLGILYTEKEFHQKAGAALERAARLLKARGGPPDERTGAVLDALADHHEAAGNLPRAVAVARRALAIREELLGPSHRAVARSLNNLGVKLARVEATSDEARKLLHRALGILDGERVADPSLLELTLLNLAHVLIAAGELEEGEVFALRAHSMMRARLGADHPDTGAALIALSELAHQRGDIERAAELAAEAMKARNKRPRLAHGIADLVRMGKLLLDMEEPAEAAKFFRDALDLAARARGQDHPSVGQILVLAGRVALAQEDPELALRCFSRALEIGEKARGRDHAELVEVLRYLGETNLALSNLDAAEAAYRRVGEIYAANHPPGTEWQAIAPALLGEVAMKRKAYGRAAELFEQALSIAEGAFGVEDMRLQVMLEKAGEAQLQNGSFARAEELSLRLLALHEAALGPEHPALLPAVRRLADVYIRTKDPRTEQMVKRTMRLLETATRELNEETAMIKAETARLRGSS